MKYCLKYKSQYLLPLTDYYLLQACFTADMKPLVLAAHTNNYEIIKILLDRGAGLPCPHHHRSGPTSYQQTSQRKITLSPPRVDG